MAPPLIATLTLNPSLDELFIVRRLRTDDLNRAERMERYPGGKGLNVSRVVRELGGRTIAYGFAGGRDGQWLLDALRRLRVPHRFTPIAGTTRNNVKIVVRQPRGELQINAPGPRVTAAERARLLRALDTARPRPHWLVCAGSLPPGVPMDIYRRLIATARHRGIACALDADGGALRAGLTARPDFIKPNRQEARRLLGRPVRTVGDAARAARRWADGGVRWVVLSLGPTGAVLATRDTRETWLAHPPAVRVDSTIGAGDALVAGFLVTLERGGSAVDALRQGVACGAACAMTPGTELCHRADVERLAPRVRLQRML